MQVKVYKIGMTVFHYYFSLNAMANLLSLMTDFVKIDDIVGLQDLCFLRVRFYVDLYVCLYGDGGVI